MQREIIKKIPNGKFIRIKIDADDAQDADDATAPFGKINGIKITGDFFLHPEESIEVIEKSLIDMPANSTSEEFAGKIHQALAAQSAGFIGVSAEDIATAIAESQR
jgi:lipoate-protein ligase A